MAIRLDHYILSVRDREHSAEFYAKFLGLTREADDGPFATLRVTDDFVLLLAEGGGNGGEHLAFSLSRGEFEVAFDRIKAGGVPYGDRFDSVGTLSGPGLESGARGMGAAIYFFDPDQHLIEIRHYEN